MVLKQPVPASVSESEAITDDVLVSAALEMFGEASSDTQAQPQAPTPAATHVAGVIKSPSNHLVSQSSALAICVVQCPKSKWSMGFGDIAAMYLEEEQLLLYTPFILYLEGTLEHAIKW